MEQQSNARVITLTDLWSVFVHRLWTIILVVLIAVSSFYIVKSVTYTPKYESTATLYILKQDNEVSDYETSSNFSLALNVVNDCDYLLKSHAVLDEVITETGLDISYDSLCDSISISNPENTRILEVSVESSSPQLSKKIVDRVCEIGADKIEDAMGFQQVNLYEYGIYNEEPCNRTSITTYILAGLIVAVLTYAVFLIIFLLDDILRTDEDIYKQLKLHVIGDIPNANDTKNHKYGYYKYYGKNDNKDLESEEV